MRASTSPNLLDACAGARPAFEGRLRVRPLNVPAYRRTLVDSFPRVRRRARGAPHRQLKVTSNPVGVSRRTWRLSPGDAGGGAGPPGAHWIEEPGVISGRP